MKKITIFLVLIGLLLIPGKVKSDPQDQKIAENIKNQTVNEPLKEFPHFAVPTLTQAPQPIRTAKAVPVALESYRPLVAKYFPASEVDNALRIMKAESGGNPKALSRTHDYGLFQINQCHSNRVGGNLALLFDPETNTKVAYQIWREQGWYPWTTHWVLGL